MRLAVRSLRRSPLFAVAAILSVAVGVAANTVGFAYLYGYLIRPLPFTGGWVCATCGALAVAAVLLATATPAWRAARIDPATVLQCE